MHFQKPRETKVLKGDIQNKRNSLITAILFTVHLIASVCISQPHVQKIRQITVKDGLLTPGVKLTYKDSYGFMWFAFSTGIARYDGYTVKRYDDFLPDSCAINSYRYCTCFCEDEKGDLWIGTLKNGFAKLDRATDKFTYYNYDPYDPNGMGYNTVLSMVLDSGGDLWLGSGDYGILKFIPEADSFVGFNPFHIIPDRAVTHVNSLLEDKTGKLWLGTGGGIFQFDRKTELFTHIKTNPEIPANLNKIGLITEDKYGDIWFGTDWGVFRYNPEKKAWKHFFTENPDKPNDHKGGMVSGLAEVDKWQTHQMWIGTGTGCLVYDYTTDTLERLRTQDEDPESPVTGGAKYLFFDGDLLWASTNGITLIDPLENPFRYTRVFSYPDSISQIDSWCFYEDRDRQLWVGTFNDGLYQFDQNLDFVANYKPTVWDRGTNGMAYRNRITLVTEDSEDNLWVGTSGEGLSVFDRNNKSFTPVLFKNENDTLEMLWVSSILEDSFGVLWYATQYGLFRAKVPWQKNHLPVPVGHPVLANTSVAGVMEDSQLRLWVATYNKGIFCMSPENRDSAQFKQYFHKSYNRGLFTNRNARGLNEDIEGNIWMLSETDLFRFNEKTDSIEPQEDFNEIYKGEHFVMTSDRSGDLWFISELGRLIRFNPNDSTDRCLKEFGACDGEYYDGIVYTSFGKSKNGHLYFGGSGPNGSGFCRFHPDSIYGDNHNIPEVVLTGFEIRNETVETDSSITFKKHLRLRYDQNFFTFGFAAIDYRDPSKNQYAYMLEGFDDDWVYSGNRRIANYTGVPPGDYVFRVKGSNNNGYWNEAGTSISMNILPPIWKTWWAYLLYMIFLTVVFYIIIKYYLKRQQLLHKLAIEQLQLEKLEELDQMKSHFFANISHEFRTPLTLILGPLEKLKSKVTIPDCKDDLSVIHRNAKRLQQLINQLLSLSKLESGGMKLHAEEVDVIALVKGYVLSFESLASQKKISLHFRSMEKNLSLFVDKDKIEKILYNLLSNAFKFTDEGGSIEVMVTRIYPPQDIHSSIFSVREKAMEVCVSVADTGRGISSENLEYVFDRFYQADNTNSGDQEGTGIGLALAKELIELHHGRISVESELGKGTTFSVFLLPGKGHLNPDDIMEGDSFQVPEPLSSPKKTEIELTGLAGNVEQAAESVGQSHTNVIDGEDDIETEDSRPLILIVEDNDDLRKYIRLCLLSDYRVLEAVDGKMGLDKAIENIPDLVVSDVMMPKMDGLDLCRRLKNDERTSHIPLILLTAKAAIEDKLEGLETGADDFLIKPFVPKELLVRIKNLIVQRAKLREQFIRELDIVNQRPARDILAIDRQFLRKAKKMVGENLSNYDFSVEVFAGKMSLSRVQLHRKLKALLNQSASDFLRRIRLNQAARLLRSKSGNITQIAFQVGFNNLSYFSKCFREQFGMLPSEYVKQNRKE